MEYTIVKSKYDFIANKVEKFVRKYGRDNVKFEVLDSNATIEYIPFNSTTPIYVPAVKIELEGNFQIKGYDIIARLENIDGTNLINSIAHENIPSEYYTRCQCDHCKINRERKYTTLLRKVDTKQYVQVGNSCLKDFIGVDLEDYAQFLQVVSLVEESEFKGDFEKLPDSIYFDINDVIGFSIDIIKKYGFVSKAMEQDGKGIATSKRVESCLTNYKFNYKLRDDTLEEAKKVIEYNLHLQDNNDYNHNVILLSSLDSVDIKNLAIIVSSVALYLRKQDEQKKLASQNFVGVIGGKIAIDVTDIKCVASHCSEYGYGNYIMSYYYRIQDTLGNIFMWSTSKDLESQNVAQINATIKGYKEYKGEKQTIITNGKILLKKIS